MNKLSEVLPRGRVSALKRKETLALATMWMSIEDITLGEMCQTQKENYTPGGLHSRWGWGREGLEFGLSMLVEVTYRMDKQQAPTVQHSEQYSTTKKE